MQLAECVRCIGLIGDIHCHDDLLAKALDLLRGRGVGLIATTGDLVDGPGSADRCLELLAAPDVVSVCGNHDRWLLEGALRDLPDATLAGDLTARSMQLLADLPATREYRTPQGPLLLCHGLGRHDMAKVNPDDDGYALESNFELHELLGRGYRWILNGHSHRRMVRHFSPNTTIINAGSLGADKMSGGCLMIDFDAGVVRIFELIGTGALSSEPREIDLFDLG